MSSSPARRNENDLVEYDAITDTYYNRVDWDDPDSLCVTIVETVSAATGRGPEELGPLHTVIEVDALEVFLSTARPAFARLSFTFEACRVTVDSRGEVLVVPEE